MLSFVRDMFVPVAARPYVGRKASASRSRQQTTSELREAPKKPPRKAAALCYVARRCLGLTSLPKQEQTMLNPPMSASNTSPTATATATATLIDPTHPKMAEESSLSGQHDVRSHGHHAAELGDNPCPVTEQNPAHEPSMARKQGNVKRVQTSATDSGYVSEGAAFTPDAPVKLKDSKLRRLGQRLSAKCKNLWHSSSPDLHNEDCQDKESEDSAETDGVDTEEDVEDEEDIENHEDDDDDDDEEDGSHPRCDFKTIESITDEKLHELVLLHCARDGAVCHVQVEHRTKGTYNFAAIVSLTINNVRQGYVVRIPGHATRAHWKIEDEYMMEREVQLIEHIRRNTTAPVPKVIDYSTKHSNTIGFPYILMTQLPGKNAYSIWFDGDYDNEDLEDVFQHADNPSTATETKRITFLRSLARVMTEIQTLSFDKIGMPAFPEGETSTIGPMYQWSTDGSDYARKRGPFDSSLQYAFSGMTDQFVCLPPMASESKRGVLKFFRHFFSQAVFKPPGPETFTVLHRDLDLQNILVDEDGNITGIIDWDKAFVAPRYLGAAAAPFFLQKDWLPEYLNNLETAPHMGWKTHHYREIYAAALVEAGNPDAIYTTKSAIYRAAFMAICDLDGGDKFDLIDKLLREIPHCRIKATDFTRALYLGWKDGEAMLKVELARILEPELPRTDLLKDIDVEMSIKEWLLDFNIEIEEAEEIDEEDEEDEDTGTASASKSDGEDDDEAD